MADFVKVCCDHFVEIWRVQFWQRDGNIRQTFMEETKGP